MSRNQRELEREYAEALDLWLGYQGYIRVDDDRRSLGRCDAEVRNGYLCTAHQGGQHLAEGPADPDTGIRPVYARRAIAPDEYPTT